MTRPAPTVTVPVGLAETPAIRNTLGFLRSVIICGEEWSDACRDAYLAALKELDELATLAAAPAAPQAAGVGALVGQIDALLAIPDENLSTRVPHLARELLERAASHLRAPSREPEGGAVEHPLYTVSEAARRQLVRAASWIEKEAYDASGNDDPEDEGLDEAARFLRNTFDLSDEALGVVRNSSDEIVSVATLATREVAPAEGAGERIDWQQQDAVAGALHAVLPLDVDWQHMRVAGKAFVDTLVALRARSSAPPAREDAQPVAYDARKLKKGDQVWIRATVVDPCTSCCAVSMKTVHRAIHPLIRPEDVSITHPAPDALRGAVEALERIATVDMGGGFLGAQACRQVATKALSDVKANQKGGE